MIMQKRWMKAGLLSGCMAILLTLGSFGWYSWLQASSGDVIAYVDEDPVVMKEMRLHVQDSIAGIAAYFYQKHQVELRQGEWNKSYGGENPIQLLKEQSLEKAKATRLELRMAKELGLLSATDYPTILSRLKQENERRKTASLAGQVIYGPIEFSEKEYLSYILGWIAEKRNETLFQQQFYASDSELENYYNMMKDSFFHLGYEIEAEQVYIEANQDLEPAIQVLNSVRERVKRGEPLEEAVQAENRTSRLPLAYKKLSLGRGTVPKEDRIAQELQRATPLLSQGEISENLNLDNTVSLFLIHSKNNLGYRPFTEVRDGVIRHYTEERYLDLLQKQMKSAKVIVNDELFTDLIKGLIDQ